MNRPRATTLRAGAYTVVLTVVIAPLAAVWLAVLPDIDSGARLQRAAVLAAERVSRGESIGIVACSEGVRIRVLDAAGNVRDESDCRAGPSLRDRVGDLFFGPGGAPTLSQYEASQPPLGVRPALRDARAHGRSSGCEAALGGRLQVCYAARPLGTDGDAVFAQAASPRAIRALYDVRYPLLKLTLFMALLGVLLATWLVRRIVGPLESLRSRVLARAALPDASRSQRGIARDEFAELSLAFDRVIEALDTRARQHQAFAADLSHELKNPVAAVRAAAEALAAGPPDPARAERLARVLSGSAERLDLMITRFLELSRAEAGLPDEPRSDVDLGALCSGILDSLSADERYASARFVREFPPGGVVVHAVAGRIESALRNVLENAASFAGPDGRVDVRIEAVSAGARARVVVHDSGPGIAPEVLPRVFDRFFTTRPDRRGTGLGLAMSRAVAEAHGGALTASSAAGEGATFTLELPVR